MRRIYKQENIGIGARIRAAREAAVLSREEFAESVGISPQFAADLERGRMGASLETICRICQVLGVSADQLLFENCPAPGGSALQIQAILDSVDQEYHPYLIASLRSQVRLIQAVEGQGTT